MPAPGPTPVATSSTTCDSKPPATRCAALGRWIACTASAVTVRLCGVGPVRPLVRARAPASAPDALGATYDAVTTAVPGAANARIVPGPALCVTYVASRPSCGIAL